MQEVSTEREIPIPEPVREVFKLWRPTPLIRAHRLEKVLGTPAKIYYKYEGVSPAGSHKPNTAVPQAWYNAQAGMKKLSTETGAGQWGSSLAFAGSLFGLQVRGVPGACVLRPEALPPRADGNLRRHLRGQPIQRNQLRPRHPGAAARPPGLAGHRHQRGGGSGGHQRRHQIRLGSVLNHVLMHQTIIGQEAMLQTRDGRRLPGRDHRLHGRRQQLRRHRFPFIGQKLRAGKGKKRRIVAVEPAAARR